MTDEALALKEEFIRSRGDVFSDSWSAKDGHYCQHRPDDPDHTEKCYLPDYDPTDEFFRWVAQKVQEVKTSLEVTGDTSDGYHTFNELYEFRKAYNFSLFNEWAAQGKYDVHKSMKHSDGEPCFDGNWFVVVAELPTGQISNHYMLKDWDLFQVEARETANPWDGHSPQDTLDSLKELYALEV